MSRTLRIGLVSAAGIVLLSLLCYPFGYDQSVFAVGGELMRRGAVPFRDFMDTKPPIIFIIYAIADIIFGHHEWSVRAFDIIYHCAVLFYLYRIFRKRLGDEELAFSSVIIYVFLYVLSGFWWTTQAESFALLPMLVLYDLGERAASGESVIRNGVLVGILAGILLLLKPTLIAASGAALVYVLFYRTSTRRFEGVQFAGSMAVGFAALIGLFALYLQNTGASQNFIFWTQWVRGYSGIHSQPLGEDFYRSFPVGLLASYGFSTICIAAIGGYLLAKQGKARKATYTHLVLQMAFGLGSILMERKFFPYQYIRMFWASVPFIAIGLTNLLRHWKQIYRSYTGSLSAWAKKGILILAIGSLAFYSLGPRFFSQPVHWTMLRLQGVDVSTDVDTHFPKSFYNDETKVVAALNPKLTPTDRIFLWGNSVELYFLFDRYALAFGLTNTPLVTAWSAPQWKQQLLDSLKRTPPTYFLCEFFDDRAYITGDTLDSWGHLKQWTQLDSFVTNTYSEEPAIGHFRIFHRR
ncbi:MAG TPA: glycosyltransferase family 39 protein [Candidatus Kapabacteria bacterium]|nr:glycosyltransferase family 39 protein [Candidatus Kapabacteria bacterium]